MSNIHYTIYDNTGRILQSGYGEQSTFSSLLSLFPNAEIIEQSSDPRFDTVDTITKTVKPNTKIPETLDYKQARIQTYPAIREQLDMLWHAMNNGDMPKSEPFYSTLKDIKDAFPKGTDGYPDNATYTTQVD